MSTHRAALAVTAAAFLAACTQATPPDGTRRALDGSSPTTIVGLAGKCVDADGGSSDSGTRVQLYGCNDTPAQQWTFAADGTIRGLGDKCLDATGYSSDDGTPIELWDCNGGDNQQWTYDPATQQITGLGGKCLDVRDARSDDRTTIQLWGCWGGANQRWTLGSGGAVDGGPPDSGVPDSGGVDTGKPDSGVDTGAPDTKSPDSGTPDTAPPDTGSTGGGSLVVGPLAGATPGAWQSGDLPAAGMTMHYNFLLPHGYDSSKRYPLLVWLHENDMGSGFYDGGDPTGIASYVDGWFNTSEFRSAYPCIVVTPYADQRSDMGGATSNWGGWVPPGDHGPNEDAGVAVAQHFIDHYAVYARKVYVTGASLGGHGSWSFMLDYNARNGPFGKVFTAGMPFAGVIERYGFGVDPPSDVVARMRDVPVFAVHGSGDGTSQPNWDRAMWHDYGGGDPLPGAPGAGAPSGAYHYLEDPGLGHDVWDTYYALPAGKPLYDWLFAQTSP